MENKHSVDANGIRHSGGPDESCGGFCRGAVWGLVMGCVWFTAGCAHLSRFPQHFEAPPNI